MEIVIDELVTINPRLFFDTKFPTTPEEFDRVGVIQTRSRVIFVRIDLIRWLNTMFEKYPHTNDLLKKEFLIYCTRIMNTSFDKINFLYKMQAAHNLSIGIPINVEQGNFYYDIFIMAHKLWIDLTKQFIDIFVQTLRIVNFQDIDVFLELPNQAPNDKGKEIVDLVIRNKELHQILKKMEDNVKKAVLHIEKYEDFQDRETNEASQSH